MPDLVLSTSTVGLRNAEAEIPNTCIQENEMLEPREKALRQLLIPLLLAVTLIGACASPGVTVGGGPGIRSATAVSDVISGWPAKPQEVARATISKYGPPSEVTPTMLVWHNNGPWKRTILYRDEIPHSFPMPHTDLLQQFIDYRVPAGKFDELAAYDGSVIVERTKGEMSARCDKEEMNILALNLANDIVRGTRTVQDARNTYAQQATAFKQQLSAPLTQTLRFAIPHGGTADPDRPAM